MSVGEWFEAKRYGLGTGWPISWQGWLLTTGYVALIILSSLFLLQNLLAYFAIFLPATIGFLIISAKTTRGGWRWRWGKED
jgi:hypothetical protein